jgi:hypothetical protein
MDPYQDHLKYQLAIYTQYFNHCIDYVVKANEELARSPTNRALLQRAVALQEGATTCLIMIDRLRQRRESSTQSD